VDIPCDPPTAWQHGRQGGRIILSGGGAMLPRHLQSLFSWNIRGSEKHTAALSIKSLHRHPDHHESVCQSVVLIGVSFVICSEYVETKKAERPT